MLIDLFFVLLTGYGFYTGFNRGIVKTLLYVLSLVIGFLIAVEFTPSATRLLQDLFDYQSPLMALAGFLLCFGLTLFLIRMLADGIEKLLKTININFLNKFAGGMIVAAIFALAYSVLLWFANDAGLIGQQTKKESYTYRYLKDFPAAVNDLAKQLKPIAERSWKNTNEFIDDLDRTN